MRRLLPVLWLLVLGGAALLLATAGISTDTVIGWFIRIASDHIWGLPLFAALYAVRPFLLMPPSVITLSVGSLFGFWVGFPIALAGELLSCNTAHAGARWLMPDAGRERLSNYASALRRQPLFSVFLMRAVFLPFDLVNFACGALGVPRLPYTLGTALGILPGLAAFVSLGASLRLREILTGEADTSWSAVFDEQQLLVSGGLFGLSLVIALTARARRRPIDGVEAPH